MQKNLPHTFFSFLWYFLLEYKLAVTAYVMLAFFAGFVGPFNSLLVKVVIDLLATPGVNSYHLIIPASLIVVNFILFDILTWGGIGFIQAKYIPVIINHIISKMMDHCLGKSHQFYQDNLSGKIAKQITNLSEGIEKIASNIAANFLRGASVLLTTFIAAYFANPIFCLIIGIWSVIFTSVSIFMSKKLVLLANRQAETESVVMGELVDTLYNHSNVRIFSRKFYEILRMRPCFGIQQKAYTKTYIYTLIMQSMQGMLIACMMAFSIYFLIYLYKRELVTIGDFALIFGLSLEVGNMMWFTMGNVDEFNKILGKCKQSIIALMIPQEIHDIKDAIPLKCHSGNIRVADVKFSYNGSQTIFHNKYLEIKAGQKVGLVGYSGSGKSTFVNLILRLYDITEGTILIDNQDIRLVTQESLRANIAMIPQDPSLFHRSLMDNIRYGRIEATDAEVIEAAKSAHAHEFIVKLPEGYSSLVGERGIKLSGGQRQRVAIARAILKNAPILILDEASSQLDSITEMLIQESLLKLMQNKTTIVIAHRLSTLLHMDRILVFDSGIIIEDGNHQELLSANGIYKNLWKSQIGGFLRYDKN